MIKARNIDPASANRYVYLEMTFQQTAAVTAWGVGCWPVSQNVKTQAGVPSTGLATLGKVVDVIVYQANVGVGGTSVTCNILKNGTTIFTTNPVMALASGVTAIDTKGELAVPTGATRGVLKTDSTVLCKKGDVFALTTTVSGTYTGAPALGIVVVIDPSPV